MEGGNCLTSFIDRGSVESHRYFLARKTLHEMLRDRGYFITDSEIKLTLSDFRTIFGENPELERLQIRSHLISDPSNKILVIFCGTAAIKVATIREIFSQTRGEGLKRMILILQSKLSPQARQTIAESFSFKVEIFQITDLLFNITKHVLIPDHHILSPEEKEMLLKKYSVEDKQLPCMLETDAIARYYGLEKGQVVKVTYSGDVTKLHVTYRCVV